MELKRVDIKNFRSISDLKLNISKSCKVLVGINESGKSNIIKALNYINSDIQLNVQDNKREPLPDEAPISDSYIRYVFKMSHSEKEKLISEINGSISPSSKMPKILSGKGLISLEDALFPNDEVLYIRNFKENKSYLTHWALDPVLKLENSWKKMPNTFATIILNQDKSQSTHKYKIIHGDNQKNYPNVTLVDANINDLRMLAREKLQALFLKNIQGALFWKYSEENILPDRILIEEFCEEPESCLPLKRMFNLAGIFKIEKELVEAQNLSTNQFKNYLSKIAKKATTHFRKIWKDYKSLEFNLDVNGEYLIPGIKEKNVHDFSRRSDGFKRFVSFLLLISFQVELNEFPYDLLIIDEPETGLHPSGARYLRDELIRISNKVPVYYSTHSIFMIDPNEIGRHLIVKKRDEVTSIEIAEVANIIDEEVLYNALDFSMYSVLKESNIIFEGWRDKKLFVEALNKAPTEIKKNYDQIGFCHAHGVTSINNITPGMELGRRKCLIISDCDEAALRHQKQYIKDQGYGKWQTYKDIDDSIEAITGEDFLKNVYIEKVVKRLLSEKGHCVTTDLVLDNSNKIKDLTKWLKQNTIPNTDEIIKELKTELFKDIKASDIEGEYMKLLKGMKV